MSSTFTSNWQYRKYLQENAINIINYNKLNHEQPIYINNHKSSNSPYIFKYTNNVPPFGYENNDLKSMYLNNKNIQSNLIAPEILYN